MNLFVFNPESDDMESLGEVRDVRISLDRDSTRSGKEHVEAPRLSFRMRAAASFGAHFWWLMKRLHAVWDDLWRRRN